MRLRRVRKLSVSFMFINYVKPRFWFFYVIGLRSINTILNTTLGDCIDLTFGS